MGSSPSPLLVLDKAFARTRRARAICLPLMDEPPRARPPGPRGASPSICFCTALMERACRRRHPRVPRLWPVLCGSMRADKRRLPCGRLADCCAVQVIRSGWHFAAGRPARVGPLRTTVVACLFGTTRESRDCRDWDTWAARIVAGAAVSCGGVSHAGTRCRSGAKGPLPVHRLCIHSCRGRWDMLRAKTRAAAASMRRWGRRSGEQLPPAQATRCECRTTGRSSTAAPAPRSALRF